MIECILIELYTALFSRKTNFVPSQTRNDKICICKAKRLYIYIKTAASLKDPFNIELEKPVKFFYSKSFFKGFFVFSK